MNTKLTDPTGDPGLQDPMGDPGVQANAAIDPMGDPGVDPLGDPGIGALPVTVNVSPDAQGAMGDKPWAKQPGPGLQGPVPTTGVSSTPQVVTTAPVETEGQRAYKVELNNALNNVQNRKSYESLVTPGKPAESSFMVKAGKSALETAAMNAPAAGFSYYGRHVLSRDLDRADQMTPEERKTSALEVARAWEMAQAIEPEKATSLSDHLANILGTVAGFVASPGAGVASIGSKIAKKILPEVAARTLGQKVLRGAATAAGAGVTYGAAEMPTVAPTETVGEIAGQKTLQTLGTVAGFAAFGAGSAAAAHILPRAFYQKYDWTPERFTKEFPDMVRRVASNQGNESEVRLVQDVNGLLTELGQKPGPYAKGKQGLDVQISERRNWVDMIPVLRNILSDVRKSNIIKPATEAGRMLPGAEPGGIYDQESQRRVEGVIGGGQEPGRPVPGPGPGGEPVAPGGILQAQGQVPGRELGPSPGGIGGEAPGAVEQTAAAQTAAMFRGEIPLAPAAPVITRPTGAADFTVSAPTEPGKKAEGYWTWVDLDNPAITEARNRVNANLSGLQARDRRRVAYDSARLERLNKFEPSWLMDSQTADRGAPILDAQTGAPVAGYGRLDTIEDVLNLPVNDKRRKQFNDINNAMAQVTGLGTPPTGMTKPFLARAAEIYPGNDAATFAGLSNKHAAMEMSPTEKALADADMLETQNLLPALNVPESGDLLAMDNRPFVEKFIASTGDSVGLTDSQGQPNMEAVNRIRKAVFALMLRDSPDKIDVAIQLLERADEYGVKPIINGLTEAAGDLIKIKVDKPEFDIIPDLAALMPHILEAKRAVIANEVGSIDQYFQQQDFYRQATPEQQEVLKLILVGKSAKWLKEKLKAYADYVSKIDRTTTDMFAGQLPESQKLDILKRILKGGINESEQIRIVKGAESVSPGGERGTGQNDAGGAGIGPQVPGTPGDTAGQAGTKTELDSALEDLDAEMVKSEVAGYPSSPENYAGQARAGEVSELRGMGVSASKTAFRTLLDNVAGSKRQAQAQFNTDLLAGQEIQRKAAALVDAITAGRIKEPEAKVRWDKFIAQVTRGKSKLDQAAQKLQAGPEQRGLFGIDKPKESGMLLDKRADYKPEQQEFNYDYQQRPGEDKRANAEQAIQALEEIQRGSDNARGPNSTIRSPKEEIQMAGNTGPVKSGSIRESKEEIGTVYNSGLGSGRIRSGGKVVLNIVGRGITYNLSKTAHASLIGQRVERAAGIDELVKTARNARLETFRFLIIKDGIVVFDLPYASRLPGCVVLPKAPREITDVVKLLTQEYNALAFDFHNHPSGITQMSKDDLLTQRRLSQEIGPQYKGSMVGNHGEYSFASSDGIQRTVVAEEIKTQPDKLRTPDIPHPALGKEIRSPENVWDIIKQYSIGGNQNKIMLIGISGGQGPGGGIVQGIAEVDKVILNNPKRAWALIRSFARNTGTVDIFVGGISEPIFTQYKDLLEQAVRQGTIRDVFLYDGRSLYNSGVRRTDKLEGATFGMPGRSMRLGEAPAEYGNEKEYAIIQKAAKVLGAWARANEIPVITPEMFRAALGDEKAAKLAGMQAAIIETCNAEMKGITEGTEAQRQKVEVSAPAAGPEAGPPAIEVPPAPEETVRERIEKSGIFGIGEDYGRPASNLPPADDPGYSVFPIEMPELVQVVRELTGKFPRTKRRMRMLGYFSPSGDQSEITIKASTFDLVTSYEKAEILQEVAKNIMGQPGEMGGPDPKTAKKLIKEEYERQVDELRQARSGKPAWWAASVMAHEIGHAADWDPLKVIRSRGNIFAHIATLSNFMKKSFPMKPGDDEGLAPEVRKAFRAEAQKEAREVLGKKPDEKLLLAKIKEIYAKKVEDALESEGLVRYSDVVNELRGMIAWWHGTAEIPDYFNNTPHEMYAETLSVLLNNPAAVQKRAPNFYRMFYAYMERKPEFRAAYEKVMDDIKTSSTYENRDRIMTEDMKQSAKDMQSWADKMNERTWREWKDITRQQVDRELGPLEQRIVKIADKDLMGKALGGMERYLYRAPMQNGAMLRMENEVMKPLFKASLEIIDFDKYLFHLRVLLDRPAAGEIARPWGYDRKSSGEMLAEMRKRSGVAFNVMEELQKRFRAVYKEEALDRLRHYNIYGEDMMADLDARDAYATFQVNRLGTPPEDTLKAMFETRFGSGITSHIFKQYGTLFPVASPYTATVQKMMRLISMAERENMKYSVLQGLMSDGSPFKNEWQPAEEVFNKGEQRMEIKIIDNDKVGTVTVLHDGKLTGYYGPRVLVDSLMFARADEVQMWMKVAFTMFNVQKGILTRFNPTFIVRNVWRDIRTYNVLMPGVSRDWMNWVPGLPGGAWSRYAYPAFKAAVSIYRGAPNTIGQDALRRGFVGQQGVYYGGNALAGSEQKLQSFGHAPDKISALKRFVTQVIWDSIAAAGPVSESMTKINGMIRMDRRSNEPEWKKLIAAHTWSGSPNFWQKGAGARMLELVRMFFNPWKEGLRSIGWAFFGGGGWEGRPWETTLNLIRRTLIPRLGLYMLFGGGIGLLLKKRFDEMPDGVKQYQDGPSDFDRRNSHCLPLGWYDRAEHKVMYLTLPLSESERVFSAAFDVFLRSTVGDLSEAPKLHMLTDLMAYTAGQLPGINPVVGAIGDWGNYLTGGNPYDEYRQRFALDENQAQVRGAEGLKAMGFYSLNKLFGSIAGMPDQSRVDELPKTKWEKILSHTPGLRGYVKISNNGYRERMRNSIMPTLDRQAEIRIEEEKIVLRLGKGGKLTQDEFAQLIEGAALDEKMKRIPIPLDPELELKRYRWTHFEALMKKAGIAYAPPEIRNYMRQPTRALKGAILQEILK